MVPSGALKIRPSQEGSSASQKQSPSNFSECEEAEEDQDISLHVQQTQPPQMKSSVCQQSHPKILQKEAEGDPCQVWPLQALQMQSTEKHSSEMSERPEEDQVEEDIFHIAPSHVIRTRLVGKAPLDLPLEPSDAKSTSPREAAKPGSLHINSVSEPDPGSIKNSIPIEVTPASPTLCSGNVLPEISDDNLLAVPGAFRRSIRVQSKGRVRNPGFSMKCRRKCCFVCCCLFCCTILPRDVERRVSPNPKNILVSKNHPHPNPV